MIKTILVATIGSVVVSRVPFVADVGAEAAPYIGLTPAVILGIFFIMWMRGDLVSGKVYRERVEDYKEDADRWRTAHTVSEEARAVALQQVDKLNNGLRDMAQSIKDAVRQGG